jgi:hypothetical protein
MVIALQDSKGSADGAKMGPSSTSDNFYLYLWRSRNVPGTLYLARGFETTEALCQGLSEHGYIVKVIQMATDIEFELSQGKLRPIHPSAAPRRRSTQGPSSQGTIPVFA